MLGFGGFWPNTFPPLVWSNLHPTTTTTASLTGPYPAPLSSLATISPGTHKTEPQQLNLGFLAQNTLPACVLRQPPKQPLWPHLPVSTVPPLSSATTISPGTPKTEPLQLNFGFLAPNTPSPLVTSDSCSNHHYSFTQPLPTPPQNWAPAAWFQVFGPNPPPSCLCRQTATQTTTMA